MEKSELVTSSNVSESEKTSLADILGVRLTDHFHKYLGLPTLISRSKTQAFQPVVERVLSRIKSWKEKMLNKAGREILIKTVLQAIPNYSMNCFLFPIATCKEIERAMARFYWGSDDEGRKHHWVSWEKATRSKRQGGLGFREIHFFNMAMVAKQYWRILTHPHSFLSIILKAKYFTHTHLDFAQVGYNPSFTWRSLMGVKHLVNHGRAWRVGDGKAIDVRRANWIDTSNPKLPTITYNIAPNDIYVSAFIDVGSREWDEERVRESFSAEDADRILSIPLSHRLPPDTQFWKHTKSGKFSVRTAYHSAISLFSSLGRNIPASSNPNDDWLKLWNMQTWPKIKHFLWRACGDGLPTRANLVRRHIGENAE